MSLYKHYSFDLWLTLIRSNPEFKKKRTEYFYKNFNAFNKSLEEVSLVFRQVDLMCNSVNERTGKNIDADEMYLMVINQINDGHLPLSEVDLQLIFLDMETLLFNYLPFVYGDETSMVLLHLEEDSNRSMSILSNTGFIKGATLRKVLEQLELSSFFDFQIYSDEVGRSKPSRELFQLVLDTITEKRKEVLSLQEVVHIGDNPLADIEGAKSVGISSFLMNSNDLRITDLIKNEKNLFLT